MCTRYWSCELANSSPKDQHDNDDRRYPVIDWDVNASAPRKICCLFSSHRLNKLRFLMRWRRRADGNERSQQVKWRNPPKSDKLIGSLFPRNLRREAKEEGRYFFLFQRRQICLHPGDERKRGLARKWAIGCFGSSQQCLLTQDGKWIRRIWPKLRWHKASPCCVSFAAVVDGIEADDGTEESLCSTQLLVRICRVVVLVAELPPHRVRWKKMFTILLSDNRDYLYWNLSLFVHGII